MAPAAGKIPCPHPRATAHASASFLCAPLLVSAPAPACFHKFALTHVLAAPSAESAAPRASPSFPHPTPQIDPAVVAEYPPPGTDDRPRAFAHRTRETICRCCSAPPAPDKSPPPFSFPAQTSMHTARSLWIPWTPPSEP